MTRILTFISIALTTGVLTYGVAVNGYLPHAMFILFLGIGWAYLYIRGIHRFSGLVFAVFVLISLICVWLEISSFLALAGVTFSLTAWDLITFGQRLAMTDNPSDAQTAEQAHLLRVFFVLGLGVAGYVAANVFEITLTFGAAALLALLGIWGISAMVYRLRSNE